MSFVFLLVCFLADLLADVMAQNPPEKGGMSVISGIRPKKVMDRPRSERLVREANLAE
jgi:hypothetical protein